MCPSQAQQVASSFFCSVEFPAFNFRLNFTFCEGRFVSPCGPLGSTPPSVWIGAIVIPGALVGAALFALGVAFAVRVMKRRRKKMTDDVLSTFVDLRPGGLSAPGGKADPSLAAASALVEKGFIARMEDIDLLTSIGAGGGGVVSLALWRGQRVAVKRVYGASGHSEEFVAEAMAHRSLLHPNVVQLMAICVDPPALVLEFMARGTLYATLHDKSFHLEDSLRFAILGDIAAAMRYVHGKGLLHRDLKSLNVLLSDEYRAKVTDFGCAKSVSTAHTARVGTWLWSAPEMLVGSAGYSEKVDVYSFGIIAWEVMSRLAPFEDDEAFPGGPLAAMEYIRNGARPRVSEGWPEWVAGLMRRCWSGDPLLRPSFVDICAELEASSSLRLVSDVADHFRIQ
jgi:hypothetical protein